MDDNIKVPEEEQTLKEQAPKKKVRKEYISLYANHVLVMRTDANEHMIRFENGRYVTSDPGEQTFIEGHRDYNLKIHDAKIGK
jgi:hypothetical protein